VAQQERNPIVTGLVALVSVGLVVGLVLGVVTLVGTRVLGLSGGNGGTSSADQTLYLPTPTPTPTPSGPLVTLSPRKSASPTDVLPTDLPTQVSSVAPQITLSAGETAVAPMQQIDLTGVYPGGEGAILQVQRKLGGKWQDFLSINVAVSGGQFATYVQTGQTGRQQFRMRDTGSGLVSNVVRVQVG